MPRRRLERLRATGMLRWLVASPGWADRYQSAWRKRRSSAIEAFDCRVVGQLDVGGHAERPDAAAERLEERVGQPMLGEDVRPVAADAQPSAAFTEPSRSPQVAADGDLERRPIGVESLERPSEHGQPGRIGYVAGVQHRGRHRGGGRLEEVAHGGADVPQLGVAQVDPLPLGHEVVLAHGGDDAAHPVEGRTR